MSRIHTHHRWSKAHLDSRCGQSRYPCTGQQANCLMHGCQHHRQKTQSCRDLSPRCNEQFPKHKLNRALGNNPGALSWVPSCKEMNGDDSWVCQHPSYLCSLNLITLKLWRQNRLNRRRLRDTLYPLLNWLHIRGWWVHLRCATWKWIQGKTWYSCISRGCQSSDGRGRLKSYKIHANKVPVKSRPVSSTGCHI